MQRRIVRNLSNCTGQKSAKFTKGRKSGKYVYASRSNGGLLESIISWRGAAVGLRAKTGNLPDDGGIIEFAHLPGQADRASVLDL